MIKSVLMVFAKEPRPGFVKTRLAPPLTPEQAAKLYEGFLEDSLVQYQRLSERCGFDIVVVYSPEESASYFEALIGRCAGPQAVIRLERQSEGDLGKRLKAAFGHAAEMHYDRMVVIGSDHPTLPDDRVTGAFDYLDRHDLVIGPADDGGYYVLGMKKYTEGLFENISWSTDNVFRQTLKAAEAKHLDVKTMPAWYDVDDAASLHRLSSEIFRASGAEKTKILLKEMNI